MLNFLGKYNNFGLLILRLGVGGMFVVHGAQKIMGGPHKWDWLGRAVAVFGIHSMPLFWGIMATFSEFLGGISMILGFYMREACVFLAITMVVAASMHISRGDGFTVASHAIEAGFLFLSLIFIGPGNLSLDKKYKRI